MVKRKKGERSGNVLNELDLAVLKTLKNNKDKYLGVGDLQKILKLTHMSLKVHVRHLLKIKLIQDQEVQKHGKIPLKITKNGELILKVLG